MEKQKMVESCGGITEPKKLTKKELERLRNSAKTSPAKKTTKKSK